ncbi:MAG: peptide chain release factor N(5)-glutamine methyltransferase [Cyanobacteria bacterium P01_D01_bin.1]
MPDTVSGQAIYEWRTWAAQLARPSNVDPFEIDWLLQGVTSLTSSALRLETYRSKENIPIALSLEELTRKWQQRITERVPVQYLVGETPWRDLMLTVTPDVLIPRPETELIIEIALDLAQQSSTKEKILVGHWADLGTGSGAIALSLAKRLPIATIHATDISSAALTVAKSNAQKNNLADRIVFYKGSWLTPLEPLKGNLSAIISNPPYIPTHTVLTLQPEVTKHEPHIALDGGPDGLDSLKHLIINSANYLHPGGLFLTELMIGQAETVADLLAYQNEYAQIVIHKDLSGTQRFVSARKDL